MSDSSEDQVADARSVAQLTDVLGMLAEHSATRLEQIGALAETLLLLLRSQEFHDRPWLASSQIEALIFLASDGAADIKSVAKPFLPPRDRSRSLAVRALMPEHRSN